MTSLNALKTALKIKFAFYQPYEKQRRFHKAGKNAKQRLFLAGNRTGKTYCGCIEDAIHLTGIYPDWWEGYVFDHPVDVWVASQNHKVTRDILQRYLLGDIFSGVNNGIIDSSLILKKALMTGVSNAIDHVYIKHSSGGISTLGFKSYKQGRTEFEGAMRHLIHFDEEPPKDIYTEALMRLTKVNSTSRGIMMLTTTPLKGYTEMMTHFLDDSNEENEAIKAEPEIIKNGKFFIQASWNDNPYLTEADKNDLRANLKPHELEAREMGIPSVGTGLVYQVPETTFVIEPFEIPKHFSCVFGLDVGFFAPTAAVFLAYDKDHDVVYVYKEYSVTEKTAAQHAFSLFAMGANWIPGICDPSVNQGSQRDGIRLVDDYKKAGLILNIGKYAKELAIDLILERIRNGQFKVFSNCIKFLEEWRGYSRDSKGKIIKGRDHLMNALEFVILDGLPLAKTYNQSQMGLKYYHSDRIRKF